MMTTLDLTPFIKIQSVIARMQEMAEASDWDGFALMQQNCAQAAADLPVLSSVEVTESKNAELVSVLRQIEIGLGTLLPLAQAQKIFLARELAAMNNSAKLNRAYL